MAEPTQSVGYDEIAKQLAWEIAGQGYAIPSDATRLALLNRCIKGGINRVLYPKSGHIWSWLTKAAYLYLYQYANRITGHLYSTGDIVVPVTANGRIYTCSVGGTATGADPSAGWSTVVGATVVDTGTLRWVVGEVPSVYDLPDDFGNFDGSLVFVGQIAYDPVQIVTNPMFQVARQNTGMSGPPILGTVYPKNHSGSETTGLRYQLGIFPTPSQAWTLTYTYTPNLNKLVSNKFPDGGTPLSELILESCLALAEITFDRRPGVHASGFDALLQGAIDRDMTINIPDRLGTLNVGTEYEEPRNTVPLIRSVVYEE